MTGRSTSDVQRSGHEGPVRLLLQVYRDLGVKVAHQDLEPHAPLVAVLDPTVLHSSASEPRALRCCDDGRRDPGAVQCQHPRTGRITGAHHRHIDGLGLRNASPVLLHE